MSIQGKSLSILVPMYGGMAASNWIESFIKLVIELGKYHIPFNYTLVFNESLIPRARNRLIDTYMKTSAHTHALLVDADIGFDANDVLAMMEMDLDIVGAGCTKKSINWNRVQKVVRQSDRQFSGAEMSRVAGDLIINFPYSPEDRQLHLDKPIEVSRLGTGLMMVKRTVFSKFRESYPDRWYESPEDPSCLPGPIHEYFRSGINPDTRKYDSEDYIFCTDASAIGLKSWLCPWVNTTHMGTYTFVSDIPAVVRMSGSL